MEVKIETDKYFKNFDSKLTWKDEVDIEIDNILNEYNPVKVLVAEAEEFK